MHVETTTTEVPKTTISRVYMRKAELVALLGFMGQDTTRPAMLGLAVDPIGRFTASDGHRLVSYSFEAKLALPEKRVLVRDDLERVAKTAKPKDVIELTLLHGQTADARIWEGPVYDAPPPTGVVTLQLRYLCGEKPTDFVPPPPYEYAIPKYEPGDACIAVGLNARYFADILLVTRAIECTRMFKIPEAVIVQAGPDTTKPVALRFSDPAWSGVLMPLKVDDSKHEVPVLSKNLREKLTVKLFSDLVHELADTNDVLLMTKVQQHLRGLVKKAGKKAA